MKVKYYIKNVEGLVIPKRANESDAGYDVIATSEPKIVGELLSGSAYSRIDYIEYETNLYIVPQSSYSLTSYETNHFHTDLRPRSSISKYNLVLANSVGLIDRGYRNMVLARFKYVWNPEDYKISDGLILGTPNLSKIYNKGDKICQLVTMETHDIEFSTTDSLGGNDRGGGFGSTDIPKVQKPVSVNNEFTLLGKTTIDQALKKADKSRIEMVKAYCANFPGDIYLYQEKGMKGICVVDASGTVLNKIIIGPI